MLLSMLASDQPPVAQKITKLLIPSYFPLKVPIEEACNRCVTLVKRSPIAGARFCEFAMLEGPSKKHLMELVKIFLRLVLSPDKLDVHQIEGFLVASSYLCDNLSSEACYRDALKELIAGDKGKALLAVASTSQAHSSLFKIVSTVCPDDVAGLLEECMGVVTNCSGLPKDVDRENELRSAHKLLFSLGGFEDMFETLSTLLHKTAYRCHIKFGTDMPPNNASSAKRKISKTAGKVSFKLKVINRKQPFEDDYSVAVGIAWQVRDMLLHEDTKKAILRSQSLEMSFFALKVIAEVSIVHCGHYEYLDASPVLAYMALVREISLYNISTSSVQKNDTRKSRDKMNSSALLSEASRILAVLLSFWLHSKFSYSKLSCISDFLSCLFSMSVVGNNSLQLYFYCLQDLKFFATSACILYFFCSSKFAPLHFFHFLPVSRLVNAYL